MYVMWQEKFNKFLKKNIKILFCAKNIIFICLFLQGCVCFKTQNPALIYEISRTKIKPTTINYDYVYIVREGDTLYKIAKDNKINIDQLKKFNNINDSNYLNVGQILIFHDKKTDIQKKSYKIQNTNISPKIDNNTTLKFQHTNISPKIQNTNTPKIQNTNTPKIQNTNTISINSIEWVWPSSGKIINFFGPDQKGIDITSTVGSSIISAADGKVVYCGNGVKGLGNLIILSHKNNFITAYAHINKICITKSQNVKKGEKIAEMAFNDSNLPKLHFEIRSNGTPVNPINYLPKK